jgi:integrase/recombinase XerC
MSYVLGLALPPKTFTGREQDLLLGATGEHRAGYRDHMMISTGLATALREHEIAALNLGDFMDGPRARHLVPLRVYKRTSAKSTARQEVVLPRTFRAKLERFYDWKKRNGEPLDADAPLLWSKKGNRLSKRQMRRAIHVWQERAGLERVLGFHALRHSAGTNHYRRWKDILLTQRFMRHTEIRSTMIYMHAADEDYIASVEPLKC